MSPDPPSLACVYCTDGLATRRSQYPFVHSGSVSVKIVKSMYL